MTTVSTTTFGDAAVMVAALSDEPAGRVRVRQLGRALQERHPAGVTDYVAGLDSLLVRFDPLRTSAASLTDLVSALDDLVPEGDLLEATDGREFVIPVVFDAGTGPDLEAVATELKLDVDDLVESLTTTTFTAVLLAAGMAPMMEGGVFPLPVRRSAQPRTNVPAGSIMVAGQNAIIQPFPGPTGWRVVGRTPHTVVDIRRTDPAAVLPGDRVRFVAIGRDASAELEGRFLPPEGQR